ncbi:hypothetical protein Tco_1061064, partial [Tanacetum coccineum]
ILHILDTHFLRRLINDGKLWGFNLVKTGIIRIITLIRQTGLEVENRNHNGHRSHITHKSMAQIGVVEV